MTRLLSTLGQVVPIAVRQRLIDWGPYGYCGSYRDWQTAARASGAHDAPVVLDRTREATARVRAGEAPYEQDGVSMETVPEHMYRLAAVLAIVALESGGSLRVLDFGGALGGTYFCWRSLAGSSVRTSWTVVEQAKYCEAGRQEFADANLAFREDIPQASACDGLDVVLCNSVLQFLEEPLAILDRLLALGARCLIVDRTPFSVTGTRELTVQRVPPSIYPVSYPSWLLSERELFDRTSGRYDTWLQWTFRSSFTARAKFNGYAFRRKDRVGAGRSA